MNIPTLLLLLLLFLSSIPATLADGISKTYQDALNSADNPKQTIKEKISKPEYKVEEIFKKDGVSYYTDSPSQINHYQDGNAKNLEQLARTEVMTSENYKDMSGNHIPNYGKSVMNSFSTREIYKIDKSSESIKKSKIITDNAQTVVSGTSNQNINCEKKKVSDCQTEYVEKTCNDEVRTIQRTCDKVPKIKIYEEITKYPNCRKIDVRQGDSNGCRAGYRELLYTDVLNGPTDDDIFLCDKPVVSDETNECYVGYMVQGSYHENNRRSDYGNSWSKGMVPKKTHGRMRFMHTYNGHLSGNIVNETKNQIYQSGNFAGGQTIELPFSKTEDQVFRFDIADEQRHGFWSMPKVGVMIIYVDRINQEKKAAVESWEDTNCYEI